MSSVNSNEFLVSEKDTNQHESVRLIVKCVDSACKPRAKTARTNMRLEVDEESDDELIHDVFTYPSKKVQDVRKEGCIVPMLEYLKECRF